MISMDKDGPIMNYYLYALKINENHNLILLIVTFSSA